MHVASEIDADGPRLAAAERLPERLVLFDGECAFCDWAVRFMLARDPHARLRYAPLQGETASRLRAAHPGEVPQAIETVVYVESLAAPGHGASEAPRLRFLHESSAAFAILRELEGPLARLLGAFRVLPRALTDLTYRAFARHRLRLFGRLEACRLPTEQERARLLP